jgi:hypothetical protein
VELYKKWDLQSHYCVVQYHGYLKIERYGEVRVVSLSSLIKLYQEFCLEGVQKYGGWETSESSLVFCCSKDNGAGSRATTFKIRKQKTFSIGEKQHKRKSARQSLETGDYIVVRCSRP